jgi:peptide/nickel transport system ATP-binding protein
LDVSIQAQTLNLLQELQENFNLAYLFIAHNLSVVEHVSDAVAVMYVGRLVETAETVELYHNPKHPYTEALLSSVSRPDPTVEKVRIILSGEVPSPANPPSGCYFHPRCLYADPLCKQEAPPLIEVEPGHFAACYFADTLSLRGVEDIGT